MNERVSQPAMDVLLIEDNEDDIEIVRRVLARSVVAIRLYVARDGHEAEDVLFPRTGEGAASRAAVVLPDLILLDLGLPRVDGLDVLRRMKADPIVRHVPTVVLTGSSDESRLQTCMELGTNLYLFKPMDIADVMNIVTGVRKYWARADALARMAA